MPAALRSTASAAPRRRTVLAIAALAALLPLLGFVQGAEARRAWCKTDPVIAVGGELANVFVSAPLGTLAQAVLSVTGPNQMVVTVPNGIEAWLVLSDLGFGRGNVVTFAHSANLRATAAGIEVRIEVFVPATTRFAVRVEFAPSLLGLLSPASAEGKSNAWIVLTTVL
jgi:hypothetical protein